LHYGKLPERGDAVIQDLILSGHCVEMQIAGPAPEEFVTYTIEMLGWSMKP
jgi:hypothetical protein